MDEQVKKCICQECGSVLILEDIFSDDPEAWLECALPTGFEWTLPSGKITPIVGDLIYVDAFGKKMSYDEYLAKYQIDPEIAFTKMRGSLGKTKKKVLVLGSH